MRPCTSRRRRGWCRVSPRTLGLRETGLRPLSGDASCCHLRGRLRLHLHLHDQETRRRQGRGVRSSTKAARSVPEWAAPVNILSTEDGTLGAELVTLQAEFSPQGQTSFKYKTWENFASGVFLLQPSTQPTPQPRGWVAGADGPALWAKGERYFWGTSSHRRPYPFPSP